MNKPIISLLMPVYNAQTYLMRAIASIRAQTYPDWEIEIIDDGSTDDSLRIALAAQQNDKRIRIHALPHNGIAPALQHGCLQARGAWIARMDADDECTPNRLAEQWSHIEKHPGCQVVSCLVRYGGSQAGYAAHVEWLNRIREPSEIRRNRFVESPVAHPSMMFHRSLLDRLGGYRQGPFPEDYELWLRWMDAGILFHKVPKELLHWNDPPGRLSRTDPRYGTDAFYSLKCQYLARWLDRHLDPRKSLWLWGAGRVTRRRFDSLERAGHPFAGFIDIDPRKQGRHRDGREVVMPDQLPDKSSSFILVGVGNRGARERIIAELHQRGWEEEQDFLAVA